MNAGSVEMLFGDPGAFWVLPGPDYQLPRTSYDLTKAAERIRAAPYPRAQEDAQSVLHPPAEEEMLELFGKSEWRQSDYRPLTPHSAAKETDVAKFWLEPISLARSTGFSPRELRKIQAIVSANADALLEAWNGCFTD